MRPQPRTYRSAITEGARWAAYEQALCSGDVVNAAGTVVGTPGPDVPRGGEGNDAIFDLGGKDKISGLGGDGAVCSGKQRHPRWWRGRRHLPRGEGKDLLLGGPGGDSLLGLRGADRLNTIDGSCANDLASGGPGQDTWEADRKDKKVSCR
jgi:Ca2+-binding RTX toxin-like protein